MCGCFGALASPSLVYFELFFYIWYKVRVQLHSFACGYSVFLITFIEETVLFFSPLCGFDTLVEDDLTICKRLSLGSVICSISLYVSLYAGTIRF